MNDELKNKLNEFLGKIIEGMEKAGDFAVDQIPEVVQQALTWFALKSAIGFILGLAFLISAIWLAKKLFNKKDGLAHNYNSDGVLYSKFEEPVACVFGGFGCIILIVVGIGSIASNLEWLQILVAPKWFVVSEMSKLVG